MNRYFLCKSLQTFFLHALFLIVIHVFATPCVNAENNLEEGLTSKELKREGWYLFVSEDCEDCHWLKTEFLPKLAETTKLPPLFAANVDLKGRFELLINVEQVAGFPGGDFPVLLAGEQAWYGPKQIKTSRTDIVKVAREKALLSRDVWDLMCQHANMLSRLEVLGNSKSEVDSQPTESQAKTAHGDSKVREARIIFFEKPGCSECSRVSKIVNALSTEFDDVKVARVNVLEPQNRYLQLAVTRELGGSQDDLLDAPLLASGQRFLSAEQLTYPNIKDLFRSAPDEVFWQHWDQQQWRRLGKQNMADLKNTLQLSAIILAALTDGINPCAFAVIVFLMSYLVMLQKDGQWLVLKVGMAFAAGVFTLYMLLGMSLLQVLRFFQSIPWVSVMLMAVAALLCFGFAAGAFWDVAVGLKKGAGAMRFGMPKRFHVLIHRLIRNRLAARMMMLVSFVIGMAVSSVELVCTGQVYFPVLMAINAGDFSVSAFSLLLVYNFFFVLPLLILVILVAKTGKVDFLATWARKHAVKTRAIVGGVLLTLGGVLFLYAVSAAREVLSGLVS